MTGTDIFLKRLMNSILIVLLVLVSYNVGKQSTITKVLNILDQEEQVTKETVILDDLKLDISKLR